MLETSPIGITILDADGNIVWYDGIDNPPEMLPARARWYTPWTYGRWRGVNGPENPSGAGVDAPDDGGASPS